MAFGELTTRKINYTNSTDKAMNWLNDNFGKFSLTHKNNDVVMTNPIEEPVLENLKKDEGGFEIKS